MRQITLILLLIFVSNAHASRVEVTLDQLKSVNGVRYIEESGNPFSGRAVDYYDTGGKRLQVEFRNGVKHGKETAWYEDGQIKYMVRYNQGKPQGMGSSWHSSQGVERPPKKFVDCGDRTLVETECANGDSERCADLKAISAFCGDPAEGADKGKRAEFVFCDGREDMAEVCGDR